MKNVQVLESVTADCVFLNRVESRKVGGQMIDQYCFQTYRREPAVGIKPDCCARLAVERLRQDSKRRNKVAQRSLACR